MLVAINQKEQLLKARLILIALASVFLCSCEKSTDVSAALGAEYGLLDEYPKIPHGLYQIEGRLLTDAYFPPENGEVIPLSLALDNGYKVLASGSQFGNHSIVIAPIAIYCGEQEALIGNQLSKAYLDNRAEGAQLVFDVYGEKFMSLGSPKFDLAGPCVETLKYW